MATLKTELKRRQDMDVFLKSRLAPACAWEFRSNAHRATLILAFQRCADAVENARPPTDEA